MGFKEKRMQIKHPWNGFFEFCHKINRVHNVKNELKNLSKRLNHALKISKKSYPFVGKFEKVVLNKPFELAPKSSRVLTITPSNHFFKQGTSFIIDNRLQDKGICTYNVYCVRKEKELPIMLNNPDDRKVTIDKGSIGYTF